VSDENDLDEATNLWHRTSHFMEPPPPSPPASSMLSRASSVISRTSSIISLASPSIHRVSPSLSNRPPPARTPEPINVDAPEEGVITVEARICDGLVIQFDKGINPYLRYPFALHGEKTLPWDVMRLTRGMLVVRALTCTKVCAAGHHECVSCRNLLDGGHGYLPGIVERMNGHVHENTPLAFHGVAGLIETIRRKERQIRALRFTKLNTDRVIARFTSQMDDTKRLHLAIASGKARNVDVLFRAAINHKRTIRKTLERYCDAAAGVYKPRNTSEEAIMQGLLIWRVGGVRVAQFAHLALGLPSISVLRRESTILPIMPSPDFPTLSEIERNMHAVFTDGLLDTLKEGGEKVLHLVLMLDEIATEKRPRWDDRTNHILGLCREHASRTTTVFENQQVLDDIMGCVKDGSVHYASEV
jgi:hypothetical protein